MRRGLVTGGAGFIGSHIVRRMLERGWDVIVLDDLSTGRRSNLAGVAGDVEFVEGDICAVETLRDVVRGCDAVVHQAALPSVPRSVADPIASHTVNATGTLRATMDAFEPQALVGGR